MYALNDIDDRLAARVAHPAQKRRGRGTPTDLSCDMYVSEPACPPIIEDFMTMARTLEGIVTVEGTMARRQSWSSPRTGECAYRPTARLEANARRARCRSVDHGAGFAGPLAHW